jgi:hypothetical protein
MSDKARRPEDSRGPEPGRSAPNNDAADPFRLEAYLERQHAEFADGPSMAEILDDMDRYRQPVTPGGETIVESLHAARGEREQQLSEAWEQ